MTNRRDLIAGAFALGATAMSGAAVAATSDYAADFDDLWRLLDAKYCYFGEKAVDWEKVRRVYGPQAQRCTTVDAFAGVLRRTLNELYDAHTHMSQTPDGEPRYIRMRFDHSLRGLAIDAPVEFQGINIGRVVSINLDYDEKAQRFPLIVGAVVYPQRLGRVHDKLVAIAQARGEDADLAQMMGQLVAHGLRAQARSGNLLTGQLYIALDFIPNAPKVDFDINARPMQIPTAPGSFDKLQEQLGVIVDKVQKIPFDSIGKHLDQTLADLDGTLKQVNGQVLPEFKNTLKGAQQTLGTADSALSSDSPLQQNLGATMQELQRAARSLRVLTDYLGGHPEALIRGRKADPAPPKPTPVDTPTPPPPSGKPQPQGSKP